MVPLALCPSMVNVPETVVNSSLVRVARTGNTPQLDSTVPLQFPVTRGVGSPGPPGSWHPGRHPSAPAATSNRDTSFTGPSAANRIPASRRLITASGTRFRRLPDYRTDHQLTEVRHYVARRWLAHEAKALLICWCPGIGRQRCHHNDPIGGSASRSITTVNAGGGDRTHTARRPRDFKSRASASSATPACLYCTCR